MNMKILLFSVVICICCGIAPAQTSYGNLIQGNSGNGGGDTNSYIGYEAGVNSGGTHNTFMGYRSGLNATSDVGTFFGSYSGSSGNTGYGNAFFGVNSGRNNTSGGNNNFLGTASGYSNTTGSYNNFLGFNSGYHNISGDGNVFIGHYAGFENTEGDNNTFLGRVSGQENTSGNNNTFSGRGSGRYNTTGNDNVAYGYRALRNNTTSGKNVAIGARALYTQSYDNGNTTFDSNNVAVGYEALYSNQPTSGSEGKWNSAFGNQTLYSNITGWDNTANGYQALYSNNAGWRNTANGSLALRDNTMGQQNTAVGSLALRHNTEGQQNTAVGGSTLHVNTTGSENTALGYSAGPAAGLTNLFNTTAIGYGTITTASNQVRIGDVFVTSIGGYQPWANLSDARFKKEIKEDIPGLDFIIQLRPVSYELDRAKLHSFLGKEETEGSTASESRRRNIGFMAQEVEQILKENEYPAIGIETPQNEKDHYSIRYSEFVVPLVKGMQELNAKNEEQKQRIETLEQELETLKNLFYGNDITTSTTSVTGLKENISLEGFVLEQNTPNPFNQATTITAELPATVNKAKIVVYNLQGVEVQSYLIDKRGRIAIEIEGGALQPGMYLYVLLADEQLIDTKKMILTK